MARAPVAVGRGHGERRPPRAPAPPPNGNPVGHAATRCPGAISSAGAGAPASATRGGAAARATTRAAEARLAKAHRPGAARVRARQRLHRPPLLRLPAARAVLAPQPCLPPGPLAPIDVFDGTNAQGVRRVAALTKVLSTTSTRRPGRGETGFPHAPLRGAMFTSVVQTRPQAGGWGNPFSPSPCLRARPACGRGYGGTGFPMFTSAVHAAPPHTDGMKKGSSWEGAALPDPPIGRGPGARASGPHPQGDNRVLLGGLCPPRPSRGWGNGETGVPHSPAGRGRGSPFPCGAGAWGNPVSPHPCARAAPAQPLSRAGVWGNPISPHPCSSSLCSRQHPW